MTQLLLVALGGSLGALARYTLTGWLRQTTSLAGFYGTALVNISGSLLIGVIYIMIIERRLLHPDWHSVLMVGFLGAFTTFSTFSLDAVLLLEHGRPAAAGLYVLGSVAVCLAGCGAGMALARALI